jgi:hypothetical protein
MGSFAKLSNTIQRAQKKEIKRKLNLEKIKAELQMLTVAEFKEIRDWMNLEGDSASADLSVRP